MVPHVDVEEEEVVFHVELRKGQSRDISADSPNAHDEVDDVVGLVLVEELVVTHVEVEDEVVFHVVL